jgi:hypothetical protein
MRTFTGYWSGSWYSSGYGTSGCQSITISQTGTSLSGTLTLTNVGDCKATLAGVPFSGSVTVSGASMTISVVTVCGHAGQLFLTNCTLNGDTI